MGAVAIGATIYFGSPESDRQIQETSIAFYKAHELGMATVLWCYLRNDAFKKDKDYSFSADHNGGYLVLENFGKTNKLVYDKLTTDHPIDLTRYQVANCYMGRAGLINSGGASGEDDFSAAAKTAVINKRAGGMGLILGRKAFQRPFKEGIKMLNLIQNIYLDKNITIA